MKTFLLKHCSDFVGWPLLLSSFYLSGIVYTNFFQYHSPIFLLLFFAFLSFLLGIIISKCHDIEKRYKK